MHRPLWKKIFIIVMVTLLTATAVPHAASTVQDDGKQYTLPPPITIDMPLEEAMCRRMSVRDFTGEDISEEMLSTILWAAYGFNDGRRTIRGIDMAYGAHLYVLKSDGAYLYDAENHSLLSWKDGDFRDIGQYDDAAVKIGIVWDTHVSSDEMDVCAEIGEIGQNVYFAANALGLGTVTTTFQVEELSSIDLPSHHIPKVIMPVGPPAQPYDFTYESISSPLPPIQNSSCSLSAAIAERNEATAWEGNLTVQEQTQILWAAYGSSYLIDNVNEKRHRTLPSAGGQYPLLIYMANASGLYLYLPHLHGVRQLIEDDIREELAQASELFTSSAPCILVSVLNPSAPEKYLWMWHYESGASAYNVLLEATAWGLSSNIITSLDHASIRSVLGISDNHLPLFTIPVGREKTVEDTTPPEVNTEQPQEGYLYLLGQEIIPLGITLVMGPLTAATTASDNYALQVVRFYVNGQAINDSCTPPFICDLPMSLTPRRQILEVNAYDYKGNMAATSLSYLKIG